MFQTIMPVYSRKYIFETFHLKIQGSKFEKPIANQTDPKLRQGKFLLSYLTQKYQRKMSFRGMVQGIKNKVSGGGQDNPKKLYTFGQKIGSGQFATVYVVQRKNSTDETEYAMKVIDRAELRTEADIEGLKLEIAILQEVDYPGIVKLYQVHQAPKEVYLLMEMARGGELFEQIVAKTKDGAFSEAEAARIIKQILEAMNYIHGKNIVHRDLKPENLLLEDNSPDARVKVADFGFAAYCHEPLTDGCGTLVYVAPEILRSDPYRTSPDMWSLGVIAYILLCGYPPFFDPDQEKLSKKIMRGRYHFRRQDWDVVSDDAKNFIRHLLQRDPVRRYTSERCLSHPWIENYVDYDNQLNIDAELRDFKAKMLLKRAMLGIRAVNNLRTLLAGYNPDNDESLEDDLSEGPMEGN
eukprot:maker-scaffold_1-snap-gene-21.50-mRNA-1 protein AED:0.04 eAED:0.04 QI:40/1/1/1/0.75/0.6/5/70/408